MKNLFFLSLFFVSLTFAEAQPLDTFSKHRLSLAYFGETFSHPGISAKHGFLLKDWKKEKLKKNGISKTRKFELLLDNKLAWYRHPRNHSGLLFSSGITFSRLSHSGFFWNIGLFAGGLNKRLNEDTYEVTDNNEVIKAKGVGTLNLAYGLNTSLGKHLAFKKKLTPFSWFLGTNIFFSKPFNTSYLTHNALEVGLMYKIKP